MTSARLINLEDLTLLYRDDGHAASAVAIMAGVHDGRYREQKLARLLRNHAEKRVEGEEVDLRDSFDFLLAYYSLLEIASIIGYVPDTLPGDFRDQALGDLSQPSVRRYYEEHYPLLLPRLFRQRLAGKTAVAGERPSKSTSTLFAHFLGLVRRQRDSEAVDQFLWFLDDGLTDGYGLDDLLDILPEKLALSRRLARKPRDARDLAVHGFQQWLDFCLEFHELLEAASRSPVFQSAMWHYYGYWFEHMKDLIGPRLLKGLRMLAKDDGLGPEQRAALDTYVRQTGAAVEALLSGAYGRPLHLREKLRAR